MMGARDSSSSGAITSALYSDVWVHAAQRRYGFDLTTARRLAFVCWLRLTGRLSDWYPRCPSNDS
jgi:hypothetical protein